MLQHPRFMALSGDACKALLYMASLYNGKNNGDFSIAWKLTKAKGFTSNGNLRRAVKELVDAGFVVQTCQGGRNRPSLFALSWFPINDCNGKLDVPATVAPPNDWLFDRGKLSEPVPVQCVPVPVQSAEIQSSESSH